MQSPLTKVAVIGGVVVLGAAVWIETRLQMNFRKQDYYQQPLLMLHKYEPASDYLGRPIYGGRVNLNDVNKFKVELVKATLSIPLKGPKGKGILHVLASRDKLGDRWDIDRLDLEISDTHQRWMFYKRDMETQNADLSQFTDDTDQPLQS
uniref:Uncharacterized protein n=1 Tax=Arion vulgaris TaxID=1028688 RepID=A0A0B6YXQ7_9EUPU